MKLIVLALAMAAPLASAQVSFPAPDKPTLTMIAGQPVKAVWSNGNEAEMKFARSAVIKVPVDFQVHENLCNGVTGNKFYVVFQIRTDRLIWIWSKNSDPAKVGKAVVFKFGAIEDPLVRFSFVTNAYRFRYQDLLMGLPHDELQLQDLTWLPGFTNGALKPFTIATWTSEAMIRNGQTDLPENRIFAQINDVHVTPTGALTGTIDGFSSGFSKIDPMIESFAYIGDVVSWVWRNQDGPCLISFKPNLGAANAALFQFIATLPDVFEPYLWEQDSLLLSIESAFIQEELWYVMH